MNFHFWGRIGRNQSVSRGAGPAPCWQYQTDDFAIAVSGKVVRDVAAWQVPGDASLGPLVFVAGSLYLADNSEYGEGTCVQSLAIGSAPQVIAQLFEKHGKKAFALLDGDFCAIVFDPRFKVVYLVVDKLGCCDMYLRKDGNSVLFASQPCELIDKEDAFDNTVAGFLIAHEGFIPAPFTIASGVEAIGRSRLAQISVHGEKAYCQIERYWSPEGKWTLRSTTESRDKLFTLLSDAVEVRLGSKPSLLVSGGIDSSLLLAVAAGQVNNLVALTGSIKDWSQGEMEIRKAKYLAAQYGVAHEAVFLDAYEEYLPEESYQCSMSWMNGIRLALPLWRRFAIRLRERLGGGYNVLAGQTADTLADNNYTLPSPGYTTRRMLFSSWFLRIMPFLSAISPRTDTKMARAIVKWAKILAGERIAGMAGSVLEGLTKQELFYAGRVFGHGEMPGISKSYFPMLTHSGFQRVVDWYCSSFVRPLVADLHPANFYRYMIELSMDMNMLHLDSRLLFHTYRQEGGRAQLPFMDARMVTFFGSVPYSARAFYREPKHLIRSQLKRPELRQGLSTSGVESSPLSKSQEQLLLEGTIGTYYRELLRQPTLPDCTPGLFDVVDESYYDRQIMAFRTGGKGVNYRFIAKLGTLEIWNRSRSSRFQRGTRSGGQVQPVLSI